MEENDNVARRQAPRLARDALVASVCGLVVVLMFGASYAAVPVYNWFCRTTTGQAAYNVATLTVGAYFEKINCFCFTKQTFAPDEKREMPVVFYVDPKIVNDHATTR